MSMHSLIITETNHLNSRRTPLLEHLDLYSKLIATVVTNWEESLYLLFSRAPVSFIAWHYGSCLAGSNTHTTTVACEAVKAERKRDEYCCHVVCGTLWAHTATISLFLCHTLVLGSQAPKIMQVKNLVTISSFTLKVMPVHYFSFYSHCLCLLYLFKDLGTVYTWI